MATFWEIAAFSVDHMFSLYLTIFNINYFPLLALRAGFGFWLLQFLIFEYFYFDSLFIMVYLDFLNIIDFENDR